MSSYTDRMSKGKRQKKKSVTSVSNEQKWNAWEVYSEPQMKLSAGNVCAAW